MPAFVPRPIGASNACVCWPSAHTRAPPCPHPQRLRVLAKAADCISAGDVVNRRVRGAQQWALAPFAALVGSVMPSVYMRGRRESFGEYDTVRSRGVGSRAEGHHTFAQQSPRPAGAASAARRAGPHT